MNRIDNINKQTTMEYSALVLMLLLFCSCPEISQAKNSNIFREYIGAEFNNVSFTDVPINPNVEFHFILSFGIDYTTSTSPPSPTNGLFNIFWDSITLSPSQVSFIKHNHSNVRVGLSLGGDSVNNHPAYFDPVSVHSWVSNAISSLTPIISLYNLDSIDIDYEHFKSDPHTFSECIGQLITRLKQLKLIKYASIAPFDDPDVQSHYIELWNRYGHAIDFVNFQFYAYDNTTTIPEFINYFENQTRNYKGGNILTSFISDGSKGLPPATTFFPACKLLKKRRQLYGIFVWCADESKTLGFPYEIKSQALLASTAPR